MSSGCPGAGSRELPRSTTRSTLGCESAVGTALMSASTRSGPPHPPPARASSSSHRGEILDDLMMPGGYAPRPGGSTRRAVGEPLQRQGGEEELHAQAPPPA